MKWLIGILTHWVYNELLSTQGIDRQVVALLLTVAICGSLVGILYMIILRTSLHGLQEIEKPKEQPSTSKMFPSKVKRQLSATDGDNQSKNWKEMERQQSDSQFLDKMYDPLLRNEQSHIVLSGRYFNECPERLGYFGSQLTSLDLSNNALADLPASFRCLTGLEVLKLGNNRFMDLPMVLSALPKLEHLDASCNRMEVVPDSVLSMKSLVHLDLSHNRLLQLPLTMETMCHLRELFLTGNCLTRVPETLIVSWQGGRTIVGGLRVLCLAHNRLSSLPEKMSALTRLEGLNLNWNRLHSLPGGLCRCPSLKSLMVSHNRIRQLPSEFGNLHCLRQLDLSCNRLRALPMTALFLKINVFSGEDNPWIPYTSNPPKEIDDHLPCLRRPRLRDVVPLVDLCATNIIERGTPWIEDDLPQELAELLVKATRCAFCATLLLQPTRIHVVFSQMADLVLPYSEARCAPRCCLRQEWH